MHDEFQARLDGSTGTSGSRDSAETWRTLPGQPGQLVGQLAWFEGRRSISFTSRPRPQPCTIAAARARSPSGARPASAAMIPRHPGGHPAAELGHLPLEVGVEAEGLGEQQASVLVAVDEVEVGPNPRRSHSSLSSAWLKAASSSWVVLRVVGQQCRNAAPAWRSAGRGQAWSPRRPRRWTPWSAPVAVAGEPAAGHAEELGPPLRPPRPYALGHAHRFHPLAQTCSFPHPYRSSRLPSSNSGAGKGSAHDRLRALRRPGGRPEMGSRVRREGIRPVAPTTTRPRTSPGRSCPRRPTSCCTAWTSTG